MEVVLVALAIAAVVSVLALAIVIKRLVAELEMGRAEQHAPHEAFVRELFNSRQKPSYPS
jgi:hypothetical protein